MHTTGVTKFILAAACGLLITKPGLAETPSPYGVMAQSTWSAFQCAVLAEKANNSNEQERLFKFGYAQGLKFIAALDSGEAKTNDLSGEAPHSMLVLLQGPSPDFMLGRIFEVALRSALEDVYTIVDYYRPDERQESIAAAEFWKRNCALLGK